MYRVVKECGNNTNVFIENTESKKSLNIGRLSLEILKVLEEAGFTFGTSDGEIALRDEWKLTIDIDTKDKLTKLAMKMNKPIRNQSKKVSEQKSPEGEIPDLFDLIFG